MAAVARAFGLAIATALAALASPISASQASRVIAVATTQELYAAVENGANRDARLRLRAGTYRISRPLRLQPGMELAGENRYQDIDTDSVWDRTAGGTWTMGGGTVLDARAMSMSMAVTRDCNTGGMTSDALEPAIAITGRNRISRVTILSPLDGFGIGEANGLDNNVRPGIELIVEDTVIESGIRGVTFSNRGCASRQFQSSLTFHRNIVTGARRVGLTIANFLTDQTGSTEGPSIVAELRHNRFAGNETGVVVQAGTQGTDGGRVNVTLLENRFEGNSAGGLTARAAVSQAAMQQPSSNRNSLRFLSTRDVFTGNGAPAITLAASDRLTSGSTSGGENHGNSVDAQFVNPRIEGAAPGLVAVGGRYGGSDGTSGTGNVVRLLVRPARGTPLSIQTDDNSPPREGVEPPNRVELVRD